MESRIRLSVPGHSCSAEDLAFPVEGERGRPAGPELPHLDRDPARFPPGGNSWRVILDGERLRGSTRRLATFSASRPSARYRRNCEWCSPTRRGGEPEHQEYRRQLRAVASSASNRVPIGFRGRRWAAISQGQFESIRTAATWAIAFGARSDRRARPANCERYAAISAGSCRLTLLHKTRCCSKIRRFAAVGDRFSRCLKDL